MKIMPQTPLADVQMERPDVPEPIDRVGVKGVRIPVKVQDRTSGSQQTMASVDLAVDLPESLKGTHMSRLVEALDNFDDVLTQASLRLLLGKVKIELLARRAWARFAFPFLVDRKAPATGRHGRIACDCEIMSLLDESGQSMAVALALPVMTVCPCSLAISRIGAHSQRAVARLLCGIDGLVWLEELVEIIDSSSSCPVYSLLKREDEKLVTEKAFANPMFVEDVARHICRKLRAVQQISWFRVTVESIESIHAHNAFACIEHGMENCRECLPFLVG